MTEMENAFTKRNPDYGGVGVLLTGLPGCGKTNVMGLVAYRELKMGNIVIWRAKETCQWSVLLNKTDKIILWIKKGLEYNLIDRNKGKKIKIENIIEVKEWSTPKDLIKRLSKNKINVVQTIPVSSEWKTQHGKFIDQWIKIFQELCRRYYATTISVFIDEIEDLVPEGKFYVKASNMSDMVKELRKNHINIIGSTHRATEIFWKFTNKIPWHIYMTGAVPIKKSKVLQQATNKLKVGHAIIECQRFEWINFEFIGKEKNYRANIKLSKKDIEKLIEKENKENIKKNYEVYLMIYKDIKENNLSTNKAAKKYNVKRKDIADILNIVEKKTFSKG